MATLLFVAVTAFVLACATDLLVAMIAPFKRNN